MTGLTGRRVQAIVIGLVVLVPAAASTLALGLLVDSNAPFDHAFAAQRGAHITAAVDVTRASAARLAATTRLPGVTAASGPFPQTTVSADISFTAPPGGPGGPGGQGVWSTQLNLVGRTSPGGPVDDLTLTAGRWARQAGEVVWSDSGNGPPVSVGSHITVHGVPGSPRLTVVGLATSATGTAQASATPAEITALRAPGAPDMAQMLYRFARAGSDTAVRADVAAVRAALPPGSLLGAQSYLTAKLRATRSIAPWVPFIVAFGLIGLVMAVLIVTNVVSGAVVAGTRRIGVLKSVGFSPAQVVAAYVLQVAIPAAAGAVRSGAGRQPAVRAAAQPDRAGVRGGCAGRAALGRRGRAGGDARPDRARRAAAGVAQRVGSARCRPSRPAGRPGPPTGTARTACSAGTPGPGGCRGR